jgi:Domain of unknown function (DUF4190)
MRPAYKGAMADEATAAPLPPQPSLTAAAPRTEPLAIVSLVLAFPLLIFGWLFSFFGLVTGVVAIIFGHVARSRIRKSGGEVGGMRMALAGLIIGYIGILPAMVFTVFGIAMLVDMIKSDRERLHDLAVKREALMSGDGKLRITTSGFWVKTLDLNKEAALQAACRSQDMYLMVFTDAKSVVGAMTLEQRQQFTRERKLRTMQNASATETVLLTIDGHAALQDEVTGTQRRSNLVFLHTTIDDGDSFQQIIAWTTKSRWLKQNQELREITNSFHSEK